jgi:hypothetical protein
LSVATAFLTATVTANLQILVYTSDLAVCKFTFSGPGSDLGVGFAFLGKARVVLTIVSQPVLLFEGVAKTLSKTSLKNAVT